MSFGPSNSIGPFLPVNQTFSEDPKQFLIQITKFYADIARYLSVREIAIYDLNENLTGEQWFTVGNPQIKRNGYRKVYNIAPAGGIAAGATFTTPHGITGITSLTHIYGVATTAADQRPIPYASATAVTAQIELKVNPATGGNITIINGATAPAIVSAIVVLEFLKN